ncbi:MAG: ABC transporter permease subunit [Planctomycetota bacterium]
MTSLSPADPPTLPDAPPPAGVSEPQRPRAKYVARPGGGRKAKDKSFQVLCIAAAVLAIMVLLTLILAITYRGAPRLFGYFGEFVTGFHSADPLEAGMAPAIVGTIWLLVITAITAIPLGVGTAILLEEYKPGHPLLARLHGFVQMNITNLAGVPSIVYGILGLTVFANFILYQERTGDPWIKVGQEWYYTYAGLGDTFFYAEAANEASAQEGRAASAEQKFLVAPKPGAEVAEVQVLTPEEIAPLRAAVDGNVRVIDRGIRAQIDGARPGKREPLEVDDAKAAAMAAAVFEGADLASDPADLVAIATAQFRAMDGLNGIDVSRARRALTNELKAVELKAAGADRIIEAGTAATPVDHRSWYYLQLPFGRGLLTGGLTLMLVILPIIIVASQEAVRSVPPSTRAGALALGGTKWQSISRVVLPGAIPGICTGSILAMSRAIGEAAPMLMIGAVFITFVPGPKPGFGDGTLMDSFSAMPLQIFNWTSMPKDGFKDAAAAGIIVLLAVLLTFNALAVFIRQKYTQKN